MYQKLPSDPFIIDMDPVLKLWLYEQWVGDQRDDAELAKNHAYLLGSFTNPEAVQQMMNSNTHESSDEDLEESLQWVKEGKLPLLKPDQVKQEKVPERRRRRKVSLKLPSTDKK
jgi:hypothetical protein